MSKSFVGRRRVLDAALERHGLRVAGGGAFGGSALWVHTPGINTSELAQRLLKKSVLIEAGNLFFDRNSDQNNYFRIAYSSIAQDVIDDGVKIIAETIEEVRSSAA